MTKGKSLGFLLLGSTGLFGILGGSHDSSVTNSLENHFEKVSLEKISDFLKIDGSTKDLKDLIKDYLKTPSGSVVLGNLLASSLLVKFIDSLDRQKSALAERLQNDISSLRNSVDFSNDISEDIKKKELELFSGKEEYRKLYNVLQQVQKRFINIFVDFLPQFIKNDNSSLDNSDSADESIKKIGVFADAVLDDYITYSKPLFIKKLTWNYKNELIKSQLENLFENNSLPSGITLPTSGSYFFPFVSEASASNFFEFIKAIKASKTDENLEKYSDSSSIKEVIPLSEVTNSSRSSQFNIALLELASHAITFEKWNEKNKGTNKDNLSTKQEQDKQEICDSEDPIPTIVVDSIFSESNFCFSKLFCLKKEKNPFSQKKPSSDFFYLKHKSAENKAENWIVFKDFLGIHAMSVKEGLKSEKSEIKKELIAASKKSQGEYSWNMKAELLKHLEKHFLRIFLEKWDKIFEKSKSNNEQDDFKDLASNLAKALKTLALRSDLIQLRTNIFKDYSAILNKFPLTVNGEFKYVNPELGWAGQIPYKPKEKQLKEEQKWKDIDFVFDFWESIYVSDFSKLSNDKLSLDEGTKTKFADKFKEYKSKVDDLFSSISSKKEGDFWVIEDNNNNNKLTKNQILNLTWIAMLEKRDALDFLVQESLKDKLLFFEWKDDNEDNKKFNEDAQIEGSNGSDLFGNNDDLGKVIVTQYLFNNHADKLSNSVNPHIYGGSLDISKLNETEQLLIWLKKINDNERKVFGNSHSDLISSGNVSLFSELLAIKWLTANKFENFRKYLSSIISRGEFSAFIFSRKYAKDGLCQFSSGELKEKMKYSSDNSWDLENKYLGFSDIKFSDRQKCVYKDELFNFSKIMLDSNTETFIGYKGLIYKDLNKIFPEEIVKQLSSKNPAWKDNSSLKNYVDTIKTHEAFEDLVKGLKKTFPYIDWGIAEQTSMIENSDWDFSWNSLSSGLVNSSGNKLTIEQRKKILKGYLSQTSKGIFDSNSSWEHLRKTQEKFLKENIGDQDLIEQDKFTSFKNWVKGENGDDFLVDSSGNKYLIYMLQIKGDDVSNQSNWTSFLKTVTSDLIVKEVIKAAKEKSIQKQALFHYLTETDNSKKLKKYQTSDVRLDKLLETQWKSK